MKKILSLLSIILIPYIVLGDVLPEPDILDYNEVDVVENTEIEDTNIIIEDDIVESAEINNDEIADGVETSSDSTIDVEDSDIEDQELYQEEADDNKISIGSIGFGFCNEGYDNLSSSLSYAVEIGQPLKICTLFYNHSQQDITIEVRIVDTELNANGEPSCSYGSTNIQNFIKKGDLDEIKEIQLPAGEFITKEFEVTFPVGLEGDQTYCFTYHIPSLEDSDAMISTVINKYSFMKFFVGGIDDLKNEIEIKNINVFLDDNKDLNMNFLLSNVGNLEDKIEIEGTVSNIFGFKKSFHLYGDGIQIIAGGENSVSAALGSIPSYGGRFKIEFTATATPFFSYDISNSNIDPTLLETKEFTASTTFFQMPWLILVILIILILLIITIFRKPKKEVVYIQAPQQPTPNNGYQQSQVAQTQYQQPVQPAENQNNYGQPQTQPTQNQYTPNA